METGLRALFRAVLKESLVGVGSQVETGAPLLRLEPLDDAGAATGTTERRTGPARRARRATRRRRAGGPARPTARLRRRRARRRQRPRRPSRGARRATRPAAGGRGRPAGDLRRPVRAQPRQAAVRGAAAESWERSPRAYFHLYLQSLDADPAGLPETFRTRLVRVLSHYGVDGLERTPIRFGVLSGWFGRFRHPAR